MKGKMLLLVGILVLALGLVGTPTTWANLLVVTDGTSTVNFDLSVVGGNLQLTISSPTGITTNVGGWLGINGFAAFDIKNFGTASGLTLGGWTGFDPNQQMNNNGCTGGPGNGECFVKNPVLPTFNSAIPFTLGPLTITKSSGTFDLTGTGQNAPHLQVLFTTGGTTNTNGTVTGKTGSLLSEDIPAGTTVVPEPASLMLLGAGLAGIGIWRRKAIKI